MQNVIYDLITALTFIVILGVLVMIHELGHFLTARLFKVRVEEFGLGFPPRVYPSRAKVARLREAGKTVYSLNALPLGGFVRLAGENGVGPVQTAPAARGGEPVSLSGAAVPEDDPGAFATKPAWQRAIVLAAGAFNNMALAVLLVFFIFVGIGTPRVGIAVVGVAFNSPAQQAGLLAGDTIKSINGVVPQDQVDVKNLVDAQPGQPVTIAYVRGGATQTVRLTPRAGSPGNGFPCDQGRIGIMTNAVNERYVPTDWGSAASAALSVPGTVVGGVAALIGQLGGTPSAQVSGGAGGASSPGCVYAQDYVTFGGRVTDALHVPVAPNAVTNDPCLPQDSSGGVAGPIGIIRQVGCEANSIPTQGWVPLLTLVVELSATLAVMNLLPIPALDGGRLLFVLISVVARRRIRPEVEGLAHALGMAALLMLMFFVSWHDLMNLINNKPAF